MSCLNGPFAKLSVAACAIAVTGTLAASTPAAFAQVAEPDAQPQQRHVALPPGEKPVVAQPGQNPDQPPKSGYERLRDELPKFIGVEYTRSVDGPLAPSTPQLMDIYLPPNVPAEAKLPVIVWIHSGNWIMGNRDFCPALVLALEGCVVVSVDYRLAPANPFPAALHDLKAAIRFLRANSAKYHIDPSRIAVWGASAGGNLAAMLGVTGDVKSLEGDGGNADQSSRVSAVVDWFGTVDLTDESIITDRDRPNIEKYLGGPASQKPDLAKAASPITYVTSDDPPFLILHGDEDKVVLLQQSQRFADALKKAGVSVTFDPIKGIGHGFRGDFEVPTFQKTRDFLLKVLDAKPIGPAKQDPATK